MADQRRFDSLEQTAAQTAQKLDDRTSTLANRIASHTHEGLLPSAPFGILVSTLATTASTGYVSLSSPGPSFAMSFDVPVRCLISVSASMYQQTSGLVLMSFALSGANTLAPDDSRALIHNGNGNRVHYSFMSYVDLDPGETVFTAQYRVGAGSAEYRDRRLVAMPFPIF